MDKSLVARFLTHGTCTSSCCVKLKTFFFKFT